MTLEQLKERFNYVPGTGDLFLRLHKRFKAKWKLVTSVNADGYLQVNPKESIRVLLAHRVAYQLHHNMELGDLVVDHIDQNKTNNKIGNLRATTRAENNRNLARRGNNTSGATGVYQLPSGKWRAQIRDNKKNIHIGCYSTIEEAIHARKTVAEQLGFHENHA